MYSIKLYHEHQTSLYLVSTTTCSCVTETQFITFTDYLCHAVLQMYSLYKDPSGDVDLDFSNMTTNLNWTHKRSKKVAETHSVKQYYKFPILASPALFTTNAEYE